MPPPLTHPPAGPTVLVCAATCNRPDGLRALLSGLAAITVPAGLRLEVVIVDNNPDLAAQPEVMAWHGRVGDNLVYLHEHRRGISFARNAALDYAAGRSDFVAFIDDDEVPAEDWLVRLMEMQQATGADVVTGPAIPRFAAPPPAWAVQGGFFQPRDYPDGSPVSEAATNNVLIRSGLLAGAGAYRFDEALALVGGEDTVLFADLRDAGCRLVWASRARVFETVPGDRLRLGWLLRRWYRTGNIDALVFARRRGSPRAAALTNLGRGLVRIGVGGALVCGMALVLGFGQSGRVVRPLYTLARGCGIVAHVLGRHYQEYRPV